MNIKWLGPYEPTERHADDVTLNELIKLRVENEKLRQVLRKISEIMISTNSWLSKSVDVRLLIKDTLKGDK
jgi:hypothetical protein